MYNKIIGGDIVAETEKTTDELINEIQNSRDIESYIEKNSEQFDSALLYEKITEIMEQKRLKKSKVVARSGLNRGYTYQIFSGKRIPSRDKLLAICFGLQLSLDETDRLLRFAGYSPLYARNKRDAIIIFAVVNKKSVFEVNGMLFENDFEILTA